MNLIAQNNTVENHLTINITGAEAMEIEAQALPVRQKVAEMIARYRPQPFGNGESEVREFEVESVVEQQAPQAAKQAVIMHRGEGDAQSPVFWKVLVSSNPESLVAKETALFAIRAILARIQGHKGHRAEINFRNDPVTLSDLFALLEKFSGASGWQEMQRLSGYSAHDM